MSPPQRIWVDVTGIRPGSDSAVFAEHLMQGLAQLSVEVLLCHRDPGLRMFQWPQVTQAEAYAPIRPARDAIPLARKIWSLLPGRTRTAIQRFLRSAKALRAPRPMFSPPPSPHAATVVEDEVHPAPDELLLMLGLCGDASRFATQGVRLAVLLVDAAPILRPHWLTKSQRDAQNLWRSSTLPLVSVALSACGSGLAQAGWKGEIQAIAGASVVLPSAVPLSLPRFLLAAGPIGAMGQTRQLLLAWRRLMDTTPDLPTLVIAGEIGPLADDVLAQLRQSDGMGGSVILIRSPSAPLYGALLRDCLFCLAMEAPGGWGRVGLDAAEAGKLCLWTRDAPENAARLALDIGAWLASPPPPEAPNGRTWHDVARDVVSAVSA